MGSKVREIGVHLTGVWPVGHAGGVINAANGTVLWSVPWGVWSDLAG